MALMLVVTKADGSVTRTPIENAATRIAAAPGQQVRVIDTETGRAPADMTVKRVGDSLNIENLPDGKTIEITKFYTDCSPATPCSLTVDPADGAAATTITQSTAPIATLGENQALMYGSASSGAGAAPLSTGALLGIAAAGVALAAAGGGGGGGGSDHKDTTPPDAPTIDTVAGDNKVDAAEASAGVTVSGRAEAGSSVAVAWGSTTKTATANADGIWNVKFESSEVPADGATKISAVATDAAGNASAAGTVDVTVDTSVADTTPPDAPTVNAVTGDNVVNASEKNSEAGVPVSGTAEAGATVTVTWGEATKTATADAEGHWSVSFAGGEVPADDPATTISAVASNAAGASEAATATVVVDTTAPVPVIDPIAGDDFVNAEEAAGGSITGTAEAGSTVTLALGDTTKTTTADAEGHWSVDIAAAEVPSVDGPFTASVVATDAAGNPSAAATRTATLDTVAPVLAPVTMGPDGSVSGMTEAGGTVTIGEQTVTAGDDGSFHFAAGAVASGATATVNVTDAAGNAGTGVEVTAGTYTVGTGASDLLFAGGSAFVDGGDGVDVLIGGSGGSVRNYQFDYWNTGVVGSIEHPAGPGWDDLVVTSAAQNGWTIGTTVDTYLAGGGEGILQSTGGDMELVGTGIIGAPNDDDTGSGGRYYWETDYVGEAGGAAISQTVYANPGDEFQLSMQVSNFDNGTSMKVFWGGELLGVYDGVADDWVEGTAPTVAHISASRDSWTWTVEAGPDAVAGTLLEIRTYSPTNAADWPSGVTEGDGMLVDRVTLDATADSSARTLAGGAGSDVIWGQGGDDTLYGGAYGAATDGVADAFVYSLRSNNGNDVIKDFQVGVDQIWLIDALDTYGLGGDYSVDPHASRFAGYAGSDGTVTADFNLSFRDFVQADSAGQYLTVSDDGSGNVKIGFFGQDGSGTATDLGSVVLEGVQYGTDAGQYSTVESLFGTGFVETNGYGSTSVLYATIDGLGNERMMENLMPPV